jgi:hypothetical protein
MPVERVAVTQLRDNIFYATIWVKVGDRVHKVVAPRCSRDGAWTSPTATEPCSTRHGLGHATGRYAWS